MFRECEPCPQRIDGRCSGRRTDQQQGVLQVPGEHGVIVGMCVPTRGIIELFSKRFEWIDFSEPKKPTLQQSIVSTTPSA